MAQITIRYHHSLAELQGLNWSEAGPFARPGWFALLAEAAAAPLFATARAGDQALAMPLQAAGKQLDALSNWYSFTYHLLATCGLAEGQRDALLGALAGDIARKARRIELPGLAQEEDQAAAIARAFRKAGWLVWARPGGTSHAVALGGRDFAAYLAARPGALRSTIARKEKRLAIRIATRFLAEDWAAYEAIYAASWKPAEGDARLLRRFAEEESRAGRYRLGLALHQGVAVAAQFWTVEQNTAFIHKLAHRTEAAALSPGTVLTAALAAHAIDRDKVLLIDFGTGDDPYKRNWMETTRERWQISCLRPGRPANWPQIGGLALRQLAGRAHRSPPAPDRARLVSQGREG